MRLGTKSCLECRRRKVRCNMAPGATRCRQCFLHRIKCVPQGPAHEVGDDGPGAADSPRPSQLSPQLSLPDSLPADQFPKLRAVLDNLSRASGTAVPHQSSSSGTSPDDSAQSSHLLASVLESLLSDDSDRISSLSTQAHHLQSPASVQSHSRPPLTRTPPTEAPVSSRSHSSSAFTAAPLLSHLRHTLLTTPASEHDGHHSQLGSPRHDHHHVTRRVYTSLLPDQLTLRAIFELTQPFWSIWPLSSHFPNTVETAQTFVLDELRSCDDGGAAKRLIWLAMCISQLPRDFLRQHPLARFAFPASELVSRLFEAVRELTTTAIEPSCSLETLEALMMQYKCHLNLGRPRQGWKCVRQALDNSLLLGLHRISATDIANARGRDIWTSVWRADRQMTLFLGLPHSLPDAFLNLPTVASSQPHSAMDGFMDEAMRIGGQIVERNHASQTTAYSRTANITDQIDHLRTLIPENWWLPVRGDTGGQPLGLPFWQPAAIFFYHYVNHLLHLPYVLPGKENARFQYSRDIALASAEGMLLAFQRLPTCCGVPAVCDWLDFAAFGGAIVLVADLLAQETRRLVAEEERLWALVAGFAREMRAKSELLECIVSRQAADVLEHLYAVRHGVYNGPDEYEVVIPYFGRVCIRHPRRLQQRRHQEPQRPAQQLSQNPPQQLPTPPSAHLLQRGPSQQQHQQQSPYSTSYSHSPAVSSSSPAPVGIPTAPHAHANVAEQAAVEFNWNLCRPQQLTGEVSAMELCSDWANQAFLPAPDDWNAVYEFDLAEGVPLPMHGQIHGGGL